MKAASTFFFGIIGIELPFSSSPGLSAGNNVKLLNDKQSIDRLIGSYAEFIGSVEHSFLLNHAQAFGYRRSTIEIKDSPASECINGELLRGLVEMNAWMMKLWIIKDNSVNLDSGWMSAIAGTEIIINNNRWSASTTMADGRARITKFTKSELDEANKISISSKYWTSGPVALEMQIDQDPALTQLGADKNRFQRFIYYIHTGRSTMDVPMKIAHWCSGLEALVSSSQTELSHQVAERTASALHPISEKRLKTFKLVKQAYGIRSKAVHGSAFKDKDFPMLIEAARSLDEVCRRLTRMYLDDSTFSSAIESNSEQFNDFWLAKILVGDGVSSSVDATNID